MYQLEIFREQLIVMALAAGVALVALVATLYTAYYQPRPEEFPTEEKPSSLLDILRTVPWFLYLNYIAAALLAVGGLWLAHLNPPNW